MQFRYIVANARYSAYVLTEVVLGISTSVCKIISFACLCQIVMIMVSVQNDYSLNR